MSRLPVVTFRGGAVCVLTKTCRPLVFAAFILGVPPSRAEAPGSSAAGLSERSYEVSVLCRLAGPVLTAGSENKLRETILGGVPDRDAPAPLEALGRTVAGVAPWLELGPGPDAEGRLRAKYIDLAVKAIRNAVDPQAADFMNFNRKSQALVDAAFLAQGLLRAPKQLWGNLDADAQAHAVAALQSTRVIRPGANNWELFSAMVEAALLEFTGDCERAPIEKAVKDHMAWYKGDGAYGDGAVYHWDYYNSFVIQPMLWEVLEVCDRRKLPLAAHYAQVRTRARRYAAVQERLISPEGTFPVIGRSSAYRFGALQMLSMTALRHELPDGLHPGGVRAGLGAVIRRMIEAPGTFDEKGWLRIGVVGDQPAMGERYINRGSVYLCTVGLLQLGLPADDPFWMEPDYPWTQKRIWSGENLPADHAIRE